MGPSSSKPTEAIDLNLNHPRFANAKFIAKDDKRLMETVMGVDSKEHERWKTQLEALQK
jgi:hypothetical protein